MKKILSVILCLSLAASLLIGATSVSADEITVELDGNPIEFDVFNSAPTNTTYLSVATIS